MGRWSKDANQFVEGSEVVIAPSAARTAAFDSGWLNSEQFDQVVLELDTTLVSGTNPTLDVAVLTAEDNAGQNSRTLASFTQKTAISNERKSFAGLDRFYKVTGAIGGTATPTFTYSIVGDLK